MDDLTISPMFFSPYIKRISQNKYPAIHHNYTAKRKGGCSPILVLSHTYVGLSSKMHHGVNSEKTEAMINQIRARNVALYTAAAQVVNK